MSISGRQYIVILRTVLDIAFAVFSDFFAAVTAATALVEYNSSASTGQTGMFDGVVAGSVTLPAVYPDLESPLFVRKTLE